MQTNQQYRYKTPEKLHESQSEYGPTTGYKPASFCYAPIKVPCKVRTGAHLPLDDPRRNGSTVRKINDVSTGVGSPGSAPWCPIVISDDETDIVSQSVSQSVSTPLDQQ